MKRLPTLVTIWILACASAASAQMMNVKIVNHQSSETGYSYQVPAHFSSTSNTNANCNGDSTNVNCSASSTTNGSATGPRNVSYSVKGATFTLLLPDGRMAVVNCVSKYKLKMDYVNRRSCRMPLLDDVEADFSGKTAKIKWPVSLDGKKFESETYTILAVLPMQ